MKTQPKHSRTRTAGAAACAILLCAAMIATLASLSTKAHAEGTATPSATTEELVGYYVTSSEAVTVTDSASGSEKWVSSGYSAYDSALGDWIDLSPYGITFGGGKARISEENWTAYQSVIPLGGSAGDVPLYVLKESTDDQSVGPVEPDKPATKPTPPETSREPDESPNKNPETKPDVPQNPTTPPDPSAPTPQQTKSDANNNTNDSEIMSIRCRESEAEAKMAELQAQGYEIVRVERLPKWYR